MDVTGGEAVAERQLAESLQADDVRSFVEIFGAGWREVEPIHDYDSDPSGEFDDLFGPWYVSGEPAQLMMRVAGADVEIATPRARWLGWHYTLIPGETVTLPRVDWSAPQTAMTVGRLLRKRRSSFTYCRYCRSLTPPELRFERDTCTECSSRWLGVRY